MSDQTEREARQDAERIAREFMCECCDEYPAEPGFTECKYCRITYQYTPDPWPPGPRR